MITRFKSKTKLFSTTYLLSNATKDLKVMFTRIEKHPPTFIRKCKVNLPTLKFNVLRRQKKIDEITLFFHYSVQVVQIHSISLFRHIPDRFYVILMSFFMQTVKTEKRKTKVFDICY